MSVRTFTSAWRPRLRTAIVGITVSAVVATGIVVGVAAPASAAEPIPGIAPIEQRDPATTVTADALPTVQIDSGIVWAQAIAGDTVFAGGSFSNARPAGANPGQSLMPRSNILAYNINTGVATSFAPVIEGTVKSLAVSPDGKILYVGGTFQKVNGQTRFNVAAFDVATGALSTTFRPAIGGSYVNAIVATNSTVYFGGLIGAAGGVARKNLAAVSASNGATLGWAPTTDLQVDTMVLEPGGGKLIVGGRFGTVNNAPQRGLVALDLSDGSILPWSAPATVKNGVAATDGSAGKAGIWALTADANAVYGTGWVFANKYVGNLEGMFAAEAGSGAIRWIADCHGDHYGIFSDGNTVYTTNHEHDCQTAGGMPQAYPAPGNVRHATAYTAAAKGTLTTSPSVNDIYADWGGYPAPAAVNWFPDWVTGTASGQGQAGWTATGNSQYLLVGGEFPYVNGQRSQGLARFAKTPSTGAKQGPRLSGVNWTPTARSVSAGTARVAIPANWDRDDLNLTYELYEQGKTAPVATTTKKSTYWDTPSVILTATGLPAGATRTYRVVARDGDGNTANSASVAVTVSSADASPYANAVLDDGASLLWRLGGTDGGADWAGTNDAVFNNGVATTADDALAGEENGSATTPGNNGFASTTSAAPVGSSFATELWFKTDTTTGGKLVGYGNANTGDSGSYDRHVYMRNNGQLMFGVYPGWTATVQSPKAYNDSKWHHVVAQQSPTTGMQLYVDGQLVASDAGVTGAQAYSGYWRVGGDNLGSWPNQPSTSYFRGAIDEFAVYGAALSAGQVANHYEIGKGPHQPPVAVIDQQSAGQTVTFSGKGSTTFGDAELASFAWNFGDGATSSEATPTHRYSTAGDYTVTLSVTDSVGSTSQTVAKPHTVGAPSTPPATYTQRVLDDGAQVYWGLGGTMGDIDWVSDRDAVLTAGVGSSADDVYTGATNGSATFDGDAAFGRTSRTIPASDPFAAEVWFKTTTSSGGKIFGYGSSSEGNSNNYDRHLYMANDGRLVFGVWLGWAAVVQSSESYNDGQWHHVIAQVGAGGEQLIVDGEVVASDNGIRGAQEYDGYWRIGGDNIGGWPSQPSSNYFAGQLDDFAAYSRTLSVTEAEDHYLIAKGFATTQAKMSVSGTGSSRTFDGTASTPTPGRTITDYAWSFGDGGTASTATASHTYDEPGTYTATLTVTDSAGRTGVATSSVVIAAAHAAPVAKIGSAKNGLSVSFDSDDSTTSGGATITGYAWSFGDGETSTQADPTHKYAASGTYTVTLTVTDSLGAVSSAATADVTVAHANPTASFTHDAAGLTVSVDASGSAASDGATLSYSWNWGDGTPAGTGKTASHRYGAAGDYTVTLTVTDSLGATKTTTATVAVTHADPTASFSAQSNMLTVTADASTSAASDEATLSYAWNWGDGTPAGSGATATHTYGASGSYVITLTVTDSLGASAVTTKNVTVASQTVVASDDFSRTVASGWGSAAVGGNWTSLSSMSVAGGVGRISLAAGQTRAPALSSTAVDDLAASLVFSADKVANGGGLHFSYVVHKSSAGEYRLKVRTLATGAVQVSMTKLVGTTETTFASQTLTGYTYTAGAKLQVRLETQGAGTSTTLRGKVWPDGTTEPAAWTVTGSDSVSSLQGAGQIGVVAYATGTVTNVPVTVSVDDIRVTSLGAGQPHQAPVAVIGANASGLTAAFDGTGSTASGGATVTGYAWDFGDGATSTEAAPTHKYATGGTYTVKLAVTDSTGATSAQKTTTVSVSHANPVAAFGASATGLALAVNGAASQASDGATLTHAWNWGDGTPAGSGTTASHTYGAAGDYTVTLTVTDSMGATATTSQPVSMSAQAFVAKDDFERVLATGWGSAVTGGAWGTAAGFSVADGVGKASLAAGQTRTNLLTGVSAQNVDARLLFSSDKVANGGGQHFSFLVHKSTGGDYRMKLRISSAGAVQVSIAKVVGATETILVNRTLTGYTYTAGAKLQLRLQAATAGGSTTLNAKAWAHGTPEPADWFVSTTDAQAELQAAGQVGVVAYLSGSSTNGPVTVSVDNLEVR
ncbi:PKD domain-containing protein [Micromonospora sp. DT81.3]|uniref:PKD domain-containing protein n=1 Tax=Micromonospora sp. DT81.3 TaxID=3416523 RepID=UPI003CEB51E1